MKKIIIYTLIILLTAVFSSCTDFLEEKTYTKITNEYIESTPSGMASAVLAMYSKDRELFRNSGDVESTLWLNMLMGDDITVPRSGEGVPQFGRYNNMKPSTANVGRLWKHHYAMIGYANIVIGTSEKVDMQDPVAIQALAEAKAFRAHSYFWLIRKFDRIYLNTRVTTPENINDDITYSPADPEEVFALINEDLDYAIENLSWTTTQQGRYTQGAVRHIKAKVAAWEKDWKEVAKQVRTIEESGIYTLMPLENIFNAANLNHSEAIMVSQWSKGTGGWYINPKTGVTSGHRLSLHFAPLYNQEQGLLMSYEFGGYPWGRIFPNEYLINLYDKEKDKRYNAFYRHNWTYNDENNLPRGKHLGDTIFPINSAQYLNLHPACTKYNDSYTKATPQEMQSFKDIIIYRLAETYLMGAEAYYHLGKQDSTQYYYNKTWERAGNSTETRPITLDMIIEEHARELALEGDRWFLLKRNDMLVQKVRTHGGEYIKTGNGVVLMNDTLIRTNIQDYHVRLPIPQAQIDIMGKDNFPQNDGYY